MIDVVKPKERRLEDRRNETEDRRAGDRRQGDRRQIMRRTVARRKEACPVCFATLTLKLFCSSCKMRVIKIRN
ncbi:MAG: hypothetical protein HY282_12075 [Nitrospirae bacterium]|nr:hypothetical protein [Candidatus Manganitrophaceae bacterium]